jgi:hypothetical protein
MTFQKLDLFSVLRRKGEEALSWTRYKELILITGLKDGHRPSFHNPVFCPEHHTLHKYTEPKKIL